MTEDKWKEGIKAWEKIKAQAEIDIEQANLYIQAINTHLNSKKQEES